jgi:hypothetical protein
MRVRSKRQCILPVERYRSLGQFGSLGGILLPVR